MTGLPGRERNLISSAVWIQYTNIYMYIADRQTPADSKDRAYALRRAVNTPQVINNSSNVQI